MIVYLYHAHRELCLHVDQGITNFCRTWSPLILPEHCLYIITSEDSLFAFMSELLQVDNL